MKRINTRIIKAKYSYAIKELAGLVGVHPNTIHNWISGEGLKCIDGHYPYMVYGQVAIDFIKYRQSNNKTTLALNEFHCCKCQSSCGAWEGQADLKIMTPKTAMLKALCDVCYTKTNKIISLKNLTQIKKLIEIHTLQETPLIGSANTNPNCETTED